MVTSPRILFSAAGPWKEPSGQSGAGDPNHRSSWTGRAGWKWPRSFVPGLHGGGTVGAGGGAPSTLKPHWAVTAQAWCPACAQESFESHINIQTREISVPYAASKKSPTITMKTKQDFSPTDLKWILKQEHETFSNVGNNILQPRGPTLYLKTLLDLWKTWVQQ